MREGGLGALRRPCLAMCYSSFMHYMSVPLTHSPPRHLACSSLVVLRIDTGHIGRMLSSRGKVKAPHLLSRFFVDYMFRSLARKSIPLSSADYHWPSTILEYLQATINSTFIRKSVRSPLLRKAWPVAFHLIKRLLKVCPPT